MDQDELLLLPLVELLSRYWENAYSEGKTGQSRGTEAQQVLSSIVALVPTEHKRDKLSPMGEDGTEWYFDCDGHYIDVKRDADGKYSIFFKNRADKAEAWLDQADSERDAVRYRFLREQAFMDYPSAEGSSRKDAYLVVTGYGWQENPATVDEAVDAVMVAQAKKGAS